MFFPCDWVLRPTRGHLWEDVLLLTARIDKHLGHDFTFSDCKIVCSVQIALDYDLIGVGNVLSDSSVKSARFLLSRATRLRKSLANLS
jgi:hypothetical protein